jgi:hypothetical protein
VQGYFLVHITAATNIFTGKYSCIVTHGTHITKKEQFRTKCDKILTEYELQN